MKSTEDRPERGLRVMAISHSQDGIAYVYGTGTFEGWDVPPIEVNEILHSIGVPNPKIRLDSGVIVWGCQCWWGPIEQFEQRFPERRAVPPPDNPTDAPKEHILN